MQGYSTTPVSPAQLQARELELDERHRHALRELDIWSRLLALGQSVGAEPRLAASAERRIHPLIAELDRIAADLAAIDGTLRQRRAVREGVTVMPGGGGVAS